MIDRAERPSLSVVEVDGTIIVEGDPDEQVIERSQDMASVLEVCFSNRARAVLLYHTNLPARFFDLSSGLAGDLLQKIQGFDIRLAVVAPLESVRPSTHFEKILNRHLALCPSRGQALDWLTSA